MTGVTWRDLPPDAPEPPPLSVVRDNDGNWWAHGPGPVPDPWHCLGGALDETDIGVATAWAGVCENAPLQVAEGTDEGVADAYAPWPLPVALEAGTYLDDEPSGYEIRHAALQAASHLYHGTDPAPTDVLHFAGVFEAYLRGDESGETAEADRRPVPRLAVGTYGWRRDRDGRIRSAYLDDPDIDVDTADALARKYAEAPGYSLVVIGDDGTWVEAR